MLLKVYQAVESLSHETGEFLRLKQWIKRKHRKFWGGNKAKWKSDKMNK